MFNPASLRKQKRLAEHMAKHRKDQRAVSLSDSSIATPAQRHDKDVLKASLEADLKRLSALTSVAEKIALKKNELLPKYLPQIDAYLESGAREANPLLVRAAIWAVDVGELETAMRLAESAIAQQQLSPPNFKRELPDVMAELVADWAHLQFKEGLSASPYIDTVCEHLRSNSWPVTEMVILSKAYKVAAQLAEKNGDTKDALALYEEAQAANPEKAGCKTVIQKLRVKLGLSEGA